jgi:antitoxin VapB
VALNIKDPETDRLARQLAAETGLSLTESLRTAIEDQLVRVRRRRLAANRQDALQRYIDRGRRRAILDTRSSDEILGYDDDGLPR